MITTTTAVASALGSFAHALLREGTLGDEGSADGDPSSSWILWTCAGLAFLTATLGAVASSSLLVHSPTKLARILNGESERVLGRLSEHRVSFHVLSRSLAIGGTVAAGLLVWEAAAPGYRPWALLAYLLIALLTCGVLPGLFAATRPEHVVISTQRPLEWLRVLLHYPVVLPLVIVGGWIMRLLRVQPTDLAAEDVAEEISAAVEDTVSTTGLDADERSWIENIVDLKDTQAVEVMTPRTDITAFNRTMPLVDAIAEATQAGYSRFPVFEGKVDNVIGVFYVKDVLALLGSDGGAAEHTVGQHVRTPLFVPESIGIAELLQQFRSSRVQMAIVLDEYGGTAGLVSIEDILEEIVGDITDEYDPDEQATITVIEDGHIIETSGRARIEEINEVLPIAIPETEDYDTVAGFVFTSLDRIPKLHESVTIGDLDFEVLEGDERRIHRLRLTVTSPANASG